MPSPQRNPGADKKGSAEGWEKEKQKPAERTQGLVPPGCFFTLGDMRPGPESGKRPSLQKEAWAGSQLGSESSDGAGGSQAPLKFWPTQFLHGIWEKGDGFLL